MQTSRSNGRRVRTSRPARAWRRSVIAGLLASALLAGGPARAELQLTGSAELTLRVGERAALLNTMARGDNPFNPARVRLFADSRIDSTLSFISEILFDSGAAVRLQGAYAALQPTFLPVEVQAGLIPFGVGLYPDRCYPEQNPLIAAPLLYQHHTLLRRNALAPPTVDSLLAVRRALGGQQGLNSTPGLPAVDEEWWDTGVAVRGGYTGIEYTLGITNGTVSNPRGVESNGGKQVLGRLSAHLTPAFALGTSYAFGPYLDRALTASLPAGHSLESYKQYLVAGDADFQLGHVEASGEIMRSTWEVTTRGLERVALTGAYAQVRVVVSPGFFVAGRGETMRFTKVTGSSGIATPWDANVERASGGFGYYLNHDALLKLDYQGTHGQAGTGIAGWRHMVALQLVARF